MPPSGLPRHAPAVSLRFARAAAARWPLSLLTGAASAAAAAGLLAWLPAHHGSPADAIQAAVLAAAALVGAALGWRGAGTGSTALRFDGQVWSLTRPAARTDADQVPVQLDVALDLEAWMLLRWRVLEGVPGGPRAGWLALHRRQAPADWHAFRSAVYSARSASTPGFAGNPADP